MLTLIRKRKTSHELRSKIFWSIWIILLLLSFFLQSQHLLNTPHDYHHFVDNRGFLGVDNWMDVTSNIGFIITGIYGLLWYLKNKEHNISYLLVVIGALCVGLGSSYYHLLPTDNRLVWDRLPMAIIFSGIFTYSVMELKLTEIKILKKIKSFQFVFTYLIFSVTSVLIWYVGAILDKNWLALYVFIQFGGMILLLYLAGSSYSIQHPLYRTIIKVIGIYLLAKLAEHADISIFELTKEWISGHTMKHLLSAFAIYVWLKETRKEA